ncbi:ParA family protein [Adlercreutzia mucosicola]|uniref:AAA family ATPase n=1 Tax=Adlercreutzia mucosicola TaxID=580026 RepID=A0A6N8JPR8_9ACTN|nr:ParA family protein [Adlercreutzia mucosicola]MCI9494297.1 ParA family protein [Adlercreutzia mucosicola]MCR2036369.1 ParA family protein [Adlercreutzia mucosicola]MEB1813170.1 ParA family protein [Adlercreutzia mucosicola]MVX61049.1 AAA family ATPase [Adlercreutzia mucosicola]
MITLAAASQKGGVAKTTTNLAIGGKLAADGARVLYIDLDPQMNLSTTLKAATSGVASSLDVLTGDATIAEAAQGIGSYHVVPASRLNGKADDLMSSVGKDYRLRKALSTVADDYDFAILDTPPALGTLTVNALTAADWVVIPAQADTYSLDGVTDLAATIEAIREYTNPDLKIGGILLTRYNPRTSMSRIIHEDAEAMAAELNTKVFRAWIREATAIKEAQAVKQSIFEYAPSAKVAYDYRFFIEELMGDIHG